MPASQVRSRRRRADDSGAVTIEFAIVLIAVVGLLVMVLIAASGAVTALRCVEAAHTSARMLAIGEPDPQVEAAVLKMVGESGRIEVSRGDKWIEITVTARVPSAPWNWEVSHIAHAYAEPAQSNGD